MAEARGGGMIQELMLNLDDGGTLGNNHVPAARARLLPKAPDVTSILKHVWMTDLGA